MRQAFFVMSCGQHPCYWAELQALFNWLQQSEFTVSKFIIEYFLFIIIYLMAEFKA